jgi:WD40 repeat protein
MNKIAFSQPYTQTAPLCTLAPDLLDHIWRRLNMPSIVACTQTCTEWNQRLVDINDRRSLNYNPLSWSELFNQHFPHQSHEGVENFQQAYKNAYTHYIYSQIYASSPILRSFEETTSLAIAEGKAFTGSEQGEIQIKNLTTDQILPALPTTLKQKISAFAFYKDENEILVVGYFDGPIQLWNLKTLDLISTINNRLSPLTKKSNQDACNRRVYSLACSKGSKGMLISSHGGGIIQFWNINTLNPKRVRIMKGPDQDGGYSLAVAHGKLFAAGGVTGKIKVFTLDRFKRTAILKSEIPWITSLTAGDDKLFAGGFAEVEIWDLTTLERVTKLILNQNAPICSLSFFDGKLFACFVKSFFTPFSDITKIDFKAKRTIVLKEIADQLKSDDSNTIYVARKRLSKMVKLDPYKQLYDIYHSCSPKRCPSDELVKAILGHLPDENLELIQSSMPLSDSAKID